MTQTLTRLLILCWALNSSLALAGANYSLPADITSSPFNCSGSGPSYTCNSNIKIAKEVTITLTADVTMNISGNFSANKGLNIVDNGYALNIVVDGNVKLKKDANFTGNITASGNIKIDKDSLVTGNLTASGNLNLEKNTTVNGTCTPTHPQCTCINCNNSGSASTPLTYYAMDETFWNGTQNEVADSSGNNHHATALNGVTTAHITPAISTNPGTCSYGQFDGIDDYVESSALYNVLKGTASLSFWLKTTETGNNTVWRAPGIIGIEQNGGTDDIFWGWIDASGHLGFTAKSDNHNVKSTTIINNGDWHHIVLTRNASTGLLQMYINGNLESSGTMGTGTVGNSFSSIGRIENTKGNAIYFKGEVDEIKLFDSVISSSQVTDLVKEKHRCQAQPVAEWRFDECSYNGLAGEVVDHQGSYPASPYNGVNSNKPGVLGNFLDETINIHQVRVVSSVQMNTVWTASVWFKTPIVTTQRYHVLGSMDGGGDLMYMDRNANFRWGVYTPSGGIKSGNFRFGTLANGWHHMALVGNDQGSKGQTALYIDGSFIETVNLQAQGNLKYVGTSFDGANGGSAQGFGTALDEFIIFNEILTDAQLSQIYQNQLAGLNYDGTSRSAVSCGGGLDHFNINIGGGAGSTCSPFAFSVSAEDSSNNAVTDYSGTVAITTSTSHGNFALTSATNSLSPNPDNDDDGSTSYTFDSADNGQIDLTLDNHHAETLTISVEDAAASILSTSSNITFSENAFVIEDNDSQIATDNVPVAGRDHAYRIRMVRQDTNTGICAVASGYDGPKNLKMWRSQNVADPSTSNPVLDGDSLPNADPGSANGAITFNAGIANVLLSTSDIGKYTLEIADISNTFSDSTIAGTSAQQIVRPFGIGIDFGNLRDADFAGNGSIDDSTGSDISYAANSTGSVFTQAGEDFSITVSGVLWELADDSDDNGVPDANAYLGNNASAPSFGAEGETITLSASVFDPAAASLGSLSVNGSAGGLFNSFSGGSQTANMTYSNVGIIDLAATLSDNDYFGSGVNVTGAAPRVGRFNPFQYAITSSIIHDACVAGAFTYARQPFSGSATIEAQNKAGARTDGYRDGFATLDVSTELTLQNSETAAPFDLQTITQTESFSTATIASAQFDVDLRYDMPLQDKTVVLVELTGSSDEVTTIASSPLSLGSTEIRFGRLALDNVYGSELIDLVMPMHTEYYDGANFVINSADVCSTVTTADLAVISALTGGASTVSVLSTTASSGMLDIGLSAPGAGNAGNISITADVNASGENWLQFDWDGDGNQDNNPSATATFGIYSGDSKQIYRRQIFQ